MTHKNELGKLTQEIRANGLTEETRRELRRIHNEVTGGKAFTAGDIYREKHPKKQLEPSAAHESRERMKERQAHPEPVGLNKYANPRRDDSLGLPKGDPRR